MYLPRQFEMHDRGMVLEVMRRHNFALLVSNDDGGRPFATHLPVVVGERDSGVLIEAHVARPNPHWRHLMSQPEALMVFSGPHAYMSPVVYPDRERVPTWNYLAVHAYGRVRLVDDPAGKDALLQRLIAIHDPAYAEQWRSLGEEFRGRMLSGIVGFELAVERLEGKFKLNQHRPEAHAAMKAAYARGSEEERMLAEWMQRLGL
ncbi:MAG: FMN-binding negative transcriptional regulator [Burkholderiales bacterium]